MPISEMYKRKEINVVVTIISYFRLKQMLFLSQKKYLIAVTNKYDEHKFGKSALKLGQAGLFLMKMLVKRSF
ncbi:hypothetical protein ASU31_24020 [Pedobacter ginsenosidimutans]|uniref:Uncharacterized protein n=1 Tax=Pedobacter ginsenosidimutans TaxID=687842 RepID=A0A0T5VI20_9SPHI|nr:hypothetical protein ASU31_24020 [Pedobacter ginsenosidimutans]